MCDSATRRLNQPSHFLFLLSPRVQHLVALRIYISRLAKYFSDRQHFPFTLTAYKKSATAVFISLGQSTRPRKQKYCSGQIDSPIDLHLSFTFISCTTSISTHTRSCSHSTMTTLITNRIPQEFQTKRLSCSRHYSHSPFGGRKPNNLTTLLDGVGGFFRLETVLRLDMM